VDEPVDLGQGGVSPALIFGQVEDVGQRSAASVSARRRSRAPFEVLDRAQHEVRVREGRSGPEQLHDRGRSAQLSEPRSKVGHPCRCEAECRVPQVVLAVPPQEARE
jgi:hypothetical protein